MIYLGILFCIAIIGAVISVAFNKKSNFSTRIASLTALALMVLAVIVCLVIAFTDNTVIVDESVLIVGAPAEVKKTGGDNTLILFFLIIFLVAFFVIIAVLSLKEHRKLYPKKQDDLSSIL